MEADRRPLATANPVASFQQTTQSDHGNIWKRIEDLTITAKDKIEMATYLTKPNQDHFHSYLNVASDWTFQAWMLYFFDRKYGGGGVGGPF